MLPQVAVPYTFWKELVEIDEQIAAAVAARGCPRCGGRLHRGDYARKPRGGLIAELADGEARRISLCCDREGCRKRALPPSVRFLGRKVYVGAAIVVACMAAAARRSTGIATRTVRRGFRRGRARYSKNPEFLIEPPRPISPVAAS